MSARGRGGFTLVELLLSILILAIMMAIIYGVVVSTVQAAHRIEEIASTSEIGPAILAQVRADLAGAFLPKEGEYFVSQSRSGSTGDRDRIDFLSSYMAYGSKLEFDEPTWNSVNEVGYQVQDSKTDATVGILYRREDYFPDAEPLKGGRLTEIYDRVRHFHLEYYDGDQWKRDWNSKAQGNKLPRAVKIELKIVVTDREDKNVEQSFVTTLTFP
jgi:type II secretion system protein J